MNKRLDFTKNGVLYMYQESFAFMQDAYEKALAAIAAGLGDKWVLSGCIDNGTTVTDGYIIVGNDILPFTGGTKAGSPNVKVTTTVTKELYDDGVEKDFYTVKTAAMVALGDFAYTALKRLPTGGIMKNISDLQKVVERAINFEPAVILTGGLVSSVDTGATTCNISAGSALMDGVLVEFSAQTGATYPIYLLPDGTFNNSLPGGTYIRYNPYTSQYYKDVLKRAVTGVGEIKMFETLTDRFDGSGVGRWEMAGFQLMTTMQSRSPLGLWWNGVAVTNVTDSNHTTAGNQGGGKTTTLVGGNIPDFTLELPLTTGGNIIAHLTTSRVAAGSTGGDATSDIEVNGDGDPLSIVNPYTVVVYAKRV